MNDQRSLTDQLRDAVRLCVEAGMYDAADAIERTFLGEKLYFIRYRYSESLAPHIFRTNDLADAWSFLRDCPAEILESNLSERAVGGAAAGGSQ